MSLATPGGKRSRFRQWLSSRGSAPACNPPSPGASLIASPAAPKQSNASGTSPATHQDFQSRVFLLLSQQDRDIIQQHSVTKTTDVDALVQQALAATRQKQATCQAKKWSLTFHGHTVILQDKADNIVKWLDHFKQVGDVASNADPVHVGLPWAGIRLLLEVNIVALVGAAVTYTAQMETGFRLTALRPRFPRRARWRLSSSVSKHLSTSRTVSKCTWHI